MYKADDDWSWIATDRPHGDTSGVDDDKSDLNNEEEWPVVQYRVCDDESDDDDIWHLQMKTCSDDSEPNDNEDEARDHIMALQCPTGVRDNIL